MRTATCHCGTLRVRCEGDPLFVAMCHCELCQRRTGTSYNLGAWFPRSAVATDGPERVYSRAGDEPGTRSDFHFCPTCGTSVYWESGRLPDSMGIAVGCFADPEFPKPTISVYGKRRHHWLPKLQGVPSFRASTESAPEGR